MKTRSGPSAQILLGLFLGVAAIWVIEAALFQVRWGWRGRSIDVRGDRITLKIGDGTRRLFAVVDGDVRIDADAGTAELGSSGAHLSIDERTRSEEHWYLATWDEGPVVEWRVDGELRELDADARRWLGETLLEIERATGRDVDERVARLHGSGGVEAVLDEIEQLEASDVRAIYATALVERFELGEPAVVRLLEALASISGDRTLGRILQRIELPNRRAWEAFGRAAGTISSDEVLSELLVARIPPGPAEERVWTELAGTIGSDFELARVLMELVSTRADGAALPEGLGDVAGTIGSDSELREVLEAALVGRGADPGDRQRLLEAAEAAIGSDQEMSRLLVGVAESSGAGTLPESFWSAALTIGTDSELSRVLVAAVEGREPSDWELARAVDSSSSVGTDRLQADVLRAAGAAGASPEQIREVALVGIGSEREREELLEELEAPAPRVENRETSAGSETVPEPLPEEALPDD